MKSVIVFRVDSSAAIGSGHLMRCLTLAELFKKEKHVEIVFISRALEGNINWLITEAGYELVPLAPGEKSSFLNGYEKWLTVDKWLDAKQTQAILQIMSVECLVVDSYALDKEWENLMRPYTKKIMAIDDLANREHDCDFLLDQTYGEEMDLRYRRLVSGSCRLLTGIQYVLMKTAYYEQRELSKIRQKIGKILVFFGSSDDTQETLKFLQALDWLGQYPYIFYVIVGSNNLQKNKVAEYCSKLKQVYFYCQVDNMEDFIKDTDIAFGSAGGNTWERCMLGLPAIVTITADNQREVAKQVAKAGAIKVIGDYKTISAENYYCELLNLDKLLLKNMSEKAFSLIGTNELDKVIQEILR